MRHPHVPEIAEPMKFEFAARLEGGRLLVFCDEDADVKDPSRRFGRARRRHRGPSPVSVLIGPEGGFAERGARACSKLPNVVRLALGPRILRADTARVAALDAGAGGARRLALDASSAQRGTKTARGVSVAHAARGWPKRARFAPLRPGFPQFGESACVEGARRSSNQALARERWTMSDEYKFGIEEEYFLVDAETKVGRTRDAGELPRQGQIDDRRSGVR
jgi:hypothetical protein